MLDARRFVYILPSTKPYNGMSPGIYTSMQFSRGGQGRPAFPLNIECSSVEMASQCLQLLQPFVDRHADSTSKEILDSLADSRQWATVCAFMDTQSDIFWAVVLGKKVGIFINREGAVDSLSTAQDRFRLCDRFSTFHGAFVAMTSGGQQRVDLLAYGVGSDTTNKPNCLHHDGVDDPPNAGSFSRVKRETTPGLQGWTIHDGENWTIPIIPQRDSGNGSKQDRGATPTGTPSQGRSIPNTPRRITSVRNDGEYRPPSLSMHLSPFVTVVQGGGSAYVETRVPDPVSPSPLKKAKAPVRDDYGYWFDLYISKHSFNDDAHRTFHRLFQNATSENGFIMAVGEMDKNISKGEASFIYYLMTYRPAGP